MLAGTEDSIFATTFVQSTTQNKHLSCTRVRNISIFHVVPNMILIVLLYVYLKKPNANESR